jgi:glycosyltransferase involved in cell wall biosynthesis
MTTVALSSHLATPAEPSLAWRQAQGHRAMALGWLKRGRVKQAILSFGKAIATDPSHLEAYLELGRVYLQLRRWDDLVALCQQGLLTHLSCPELHKYLITAIEARDSLDDAYARYGLERRDQRALAIAPDEILCCIVARNERPRLDALLAHYRRLGVHRFLVCDNDSTDGSVEWLLTQPDVHVWGSSLSFKRANFGSAWFELLLRRYGVGHWCLTIDADEFLTFEGAPDRTLRDYCRDLDRRGMRAATGMLLDLYSDRPVRDTHYRAGDDPLAHCPFFDRVAFHRRVEGASQYGNQDLYWGGARQRVFPASHDYLLSKCVLLRYAPDVVLTSGQHLTNIPAARLAHQEICVLHFKFFASFTAYAAGEAAREIHAMGAEQYKSYHRHLSDNDAISVYHPEHSVRFVGVPQLQALGVMQPEPVSARPQRPPVSPPPTTDGAPPFWSVMVTVHDRPQNLGRVLRSVLAAATDDMQIAVVGDHHSPAMQQRIAEAVASVGDPRIELHLAPAPVGHPHIFNWCLALARGEWVHILHDDDWVEPAYYRTLAAGIAAEPTVASAFCQHTIVERGPTTDTPWPSWVERETPGIISSWLDRLGCECRVQFSAMAVRRNAYEAVGGFCPEAESAFDWEMWVRLAAHAPTYYVPELLVGVGRDDSAESSRLMRSGEQVTHAFAAIDVMGHHLPAEHATRLTAKARDRIADYALEVAQRYLELGDLAPVLANLQAAARGNPSPRTARALAAVLRGDTHVYRG